MADTIHLPGMGETKKSTAYMIGAGLVVVGGIAYYRSKKTAAAAQAASVAQAGGTTTDPATGYPYGSAEDAAALAAQSNYNTGAGYGGYAGGGYPYSGGQPGTVQTGFTSNAAWAQAYEEYAVNNIQSSSTVVAAALGKYLTGQPLTPDQLSIVEQAIAFEGPPPVAGTNGYPPSYQLQQGTTPQTIADGYYGIPAQGGIIYHVKGNKVWHVTKSTWQRLNPKPGVIEVNSGWLQGTGIPFMGDE